MALGLGKGRINGYIGGGDDRKGLDVLNLWVD